MRPVETDAIDEVNMRNNLNRHESQFCRTKNGRIWMCWVVARCVLSAKVFVFKSFAFKCSRLKMLCACVAMFCRDIEYRVLFKLGDELHLNEK